jgi:hypothetical protein
MSLLKQVAGICITCALALLPCRAQIVLPAGLAATLREDACQAFNKWAGGEAGQVDIPKEGLAEFLQARQRDISAADLPEWSKWLGGLAVTPSKELRAWVLARRLEGGDTRWYPEYERMALDYVRTLSGTGTSNDGVKDFPPNCRPIPGPFHIDGRSNFWKTLEKAIRDDPNLRVTDGHYAVWCFNTRPEQRELVFDVAKNVLLKEGGKGYPSPWGDPRFWIVMDWLYSWGSQEDFAKVQELLPKKTKSVFAGLSKEASRLPGFFVNGQSALNQTLNTGFAHTIVREPTGENEMGEISVHAPVIKSQPPIREYPKRAMSMGLVTDIGLEMLIGEEGRPTSCRPAPGPWLLFFAPTGIKWATGFEFEPLPTPSRFTLRVRYRRDGGPITIRTATSV